MYTFLDAVLIAVLLTITNLLGPRYLTKGLVSVSAVNVSTFCTFYPRDAMLARVIAIATCPSVRPSVRPSVTRRYCQNEES